jgi:hypothetical protein
MQEQRANHPFNLARLMNIAAFLPNDVKFVEEEQAATCADLIK